MTNHNCNSVSTKVNVYDLLNRPFEVAAAPLVSSSERSDTLAVSTVVPNTHVCVVKCSNPSKNVDSINEHERSNHLDNYKTIVMNET